MRSSLLCTPRLVTRLDRSHARLLATPAQVNNMPAFPLNGLLPKAETQSLKFQEKFKTRGQGIRIAVLDTGIDPAAAGLTSRVVDCIDATGAGDVKLREAKLVQDSKSLLLEGSSGRQLGLNPDWKNPTGKWRVGHKAAYDLWPSDLVDRRKKERKAAFDKAQAALLASASRDLTAFEATVKPAEDLPEHSEDPNKLRKQDLKDKVSVLKELASSFEDAGPILDVVSWHDGKDWRAVVGGAEGDLSPDEVAPSLFEHSKAQEDKKASSLDLSKLKPMTDFRKERHFEKFGRQDLLSYSVNFYEDGEIVSIVVVSGSHGTHVAGIIAASHPEQPELNGVAPEAELVSIRIGDPRVKGMETSQALVRAATAIIETGCQLANMSFGEDGSWGTQQKGAFITQLVEEVVRKHDIIFVNSAGNNGPCLTTLGAIPAGSEAVFSIGAWVSEAMQDAEYALIDRVPASIYTWSSRGPAYDGSRGVLAYAPGGAITSVPLYNLKHTQLMNGTSMSSPNACGNIALLLSKLQQEGKQWTPARIRKALDLTSKDVGDPLGVGLIQIVDAYEHTLAHFQEADQDAEWLIQVIPPGRSQSMRGVYLRGAQETDRVQQFAIEVTPKFKLQDTSKAYDIDLQLSLHSDASWVEAPKFVAVNGLGRQFAIRVDPTKLETGLHATLLEGRLSNGRAVFKIPITVAKPTPAHPYSRINSSFKPGQLQRNFIAVPSGATWAEVTVKVTSDRPTPCQFWLHVVQLPNLQRLSETEMQSVYALTAGEPQSKKFKVKGGTTMELVATQSWNTSGKTDIELSIDFHGLSLATSQELTLNGANEFQKIELTSSIRPESISPTFKFESRRAVIRPKESKIHALSSRNNLASGQGQYELLLTYEFKQSKKAGVTPRFATDNYLYDGPFPVLSVLHDKTKRFMVWGDVYPKEQQLEKGDYTLQLQLVHQNLEVLEKLKGLALNLDTKLEKPITLDAFKDHVDALISAKPYKFENVKLQAGSSIAAVVKTRVVDEDLYKEAKHGDVLIGEYHFTPVAHKLGRPATLVLPPAVPKDKEDEPKDKEPQKLVNLQIEMAKKIEDEEVKKRFLADLLKSDSNHLPLLVARLESLKQDKSEEEAADVLAAADAIFDLVDEEACLRFNGKQKSDKTAQDRKNTKEFKEQQDALLKAFDRKLRVLHKRKSADDESYDKINPSSASSTSSRSSVYSSYEALLAGFEKWAPASDNKLAIHLIQRDLDEERYASALTRARKILADVGESSDTPEAKEAREFKLAALRGLGWSLYLDMEDRKGLDKDILF